MTASQVIIGIHGLANKPEAETLEGWWKDAILEGLERNQGRTSKALGFDSVYWADVMYAAPIPDEDNKEPYVKAEGPLKTYKDGWWDDLVAGLADAAATPLDLAKRYFGFDEIADAVLRAKLDDLATYYQKPTIRTELRGRLRKALDDHDGKRIMVIAHSMGSIIAYDVLRALGREDPSRVVEHFVTIGSPLGLPHVKHKIYQENDLVRTPSVVRRWTNFADRRDPVAADVHLAGDYEPNNRGVTVRDDLVINGYKSPAGKANHHKSYGYLRAPEISAAIRSFF
jgi:hypothetical protein